MLAFKLKLRLAAVFAAALFGLSALTGASADVGKVTSVTLPLSGYYYGATYCSAVGSGGLFVAVAPFSQANTLPLPLITSPTGTVVSLGAERSSIRALIFLHAIRNWCSHSTQ